jgi:hypothetical protein
VTRQSRLCSGTDTRVGGWRNRRAKKAKILTREILYEIGSPKIGSPVESFDRSLFKGSAAQIQRQKPLCKEFNVSK